jgi:hypothetical protein
MAPTVTTKPLEHTPLARETLIKLSFSTAKAAIPAVGLRLITRHQFLRRSSPIAMARMIRVVACEPELPPLLMSSGMDKSRTTGSWIYRAARDS